MFVGRRTYAIIPATTVWKLVSTAPLTYQINGELAIRPSMIKIHLQPSSPPLGAIAERPRARRPSNFVISISCKKKRAF